MGSLSMNITTIANRAIQRVGGQLISTVGGNTVYTDMGQDATQFLATYDIDRLSELRRNTWTFAIRKTALRPVDLTTMLIVPPTWAIGTTYAQNIIVQYNGQWYTSQIAGNTGNEPDTSPLSWTLYFGPQTADVFDSSSAPASWVISTTYGLGALVTYNDTIYQSIQSGNVGNEPDISPGYWLLAIAQQPTAYYAGELVYDSTNSNAVYLNVFNGNANPLTSSTWIAQPAMTLSVPNIIYPIGSGPAYETSTKNLFYLPFNYLRDAPQDPTAGSVSYLGFPSNLRQTDWEFENGFLTSRESWVIVLRFVADVQDVTMFDPMFVDGLTARIAFDICEPITNSTTKMGAIGQEYKKFMGEARQTNAIEQKATQPPLDDLIACRI
jgi:hypothetical protein